MPPPTLRQTLDRHREQAPPPVGRQSRPVLPHALEALQRRALGTRAAARAPARPLAGRRGPFLCNDQYT